MTDGISTIANLVIKTIGNLDKSKKYPLSGTSYCNFSIEFQSEVSKTEAPNSHLPKYFFETVEPGCGATKASNGRAGVNIWKRSQLQPSIEEIERRYPLIVESVTIREDSGGIGKYRGGHGIVKTLQLLEPGRLTWSIFEPNEKPLGVSGGREAESAEFWVQKIGKDKSFLAKEGRMDLLKHDKVIVLSAGGGGFGSSDEE
jgi:N-methylhydantoinase B/oxoprolinase/acetone carboxylase alpha subunit